MIHKAGDGLPDRHVYLDGIEKECVMEAFESDQGWVKFAVQPIRIEDGEAVSETLYGKVTVEFMESEIV